MMSVTLKSPSGGCNLHRWKNPLDRQKKADKISNYPSGAVSLVDASDVSIEIAVFETLIRLGLPSWLLRLT
jgi:hypothetical protein